MTIQLINRQAHGHILGKT